MFLKWTRRYLVGKHVLKLSMVLWKFPWLKELLKSRCGRGRCVRSHFAFSVSQLFIQEDTYSDGRWWDEGNDEMWWDEGKRRSHFWKMYAKGEENEIRWHSSKRNLASGQWSWRQIEFQVETAVESLKSLSLHKKPVHGFKCKVWYEKII